MPKEGFEIVRIPADIHVIPHLNVTTKSRMTAHDYVIADLAVMSDMTVSEENVVRANLRSILGVCSYVGGDIFTKHVSISHPKLGLTALILEVVRHTSDECVRMNIVLFTENDVPLHCSMVTNPATISYGSVGTDVAERFNHDVLSQFGTLFYDCL